LVSQINERGKSWRSDAFGLVWVVKKITLRMIAEESRE